MFLGQVGALREVLGHVVELPLVLLEGDDHVHVPRHALAMERDRLPAVHPDRAIPEHLEVLTLLDGGGLRFVEGIHHRLTIKGLLLDAMVTLRELDLGGLHDGRRDVGDVVILAADLTLGLDAVGPVHDEGVGLAAAVLALLEVAEGRVASHGPAGVVMRVGVLATPVGVGPPVGVELGLQAVEDVGLVEGAGQSALARGTVVRGDEDEGVLEFPDSLEGIDDAPDLVVDMLHLRGEDLHLARVELLLLSLRESQAGISSMRSVSFVFGGTTPSSFCLARICSRASSQPMSNFPR